MFERWNNPKGPHNKRQQVRATDDLGRSRKFQSVERLWETLNHVWGTSNHILRKEQVFCKFYEKVKLYAYVPSNTILYRAVPITMSIVHERAQRTKKTRLKMTQLREISWVLIVLARFHGNW